MTRANQIQLGANSNHSSIIKKSVPNNMLDASARFYLGHRHRWYSFQLAHNIHKMTSLAGPGSHGHSNLLKFELLIDIDCGLHLVHSNMRKRPEESRESL